MKTDTFRGKYIKSNFINNKCLKKEQGNTPEAAFLKVINVRTEILNMSMIINLPING